MYWSVCSRRVEMFVHVGLQRDVAIAVIIIIIIIIIIKLFNTSVTTDSRLLPRDIFMDRLLIALANVVLAPQFIRNNRQSEISLWTWVIIIMIIIIIIIIIWHHCYIVVMEYYNNCRFAWHHNPSVHFTTSSL